ncbi:hypothetical protein AU156_gp140 [Edwardsiella phage PEi20]|uniref:Uncharacterized protein n=1 Tax=Edwardsiella phage PEi20 TaxID=1608310 RepID=A0A0B6VSQ4_9CAUD|nr:hypothetical protein AU156_gp140 [Edwardsiella phage PEi20]BAQ22790.1 conserved hypothetical protein [Edwardsiella phage PEi20]
MSKHKPELTMAAAEAAICEAINHAKKVADKYGLSFEMSPAYGMGGTYYSPGALKKDLERETEMGHPNWAVVNQHSYYTSLESGGWVSSSMEC